jgi:hypothetical protein
VVAFSATRDLIRIIEGLAIFFVSVVTFILIGFNLTYVAFNGHTMRIVKFVIMRNNMDIRKIKKLKYRELGTANLDGINVYYVNNFDFPRKAILGSIGAYGQKQISTIVDRIIKENPSVHVDQKVLSLAERA